MTKTIELFASGAPMACYVAEPEGSGRHAGLVLAHHQDGVDEFTRSWADRLAAEGFVVIAPDSYHHSPKGDDRDARKAALRDSRLAADVEACAQWLKASPRVDGARLGLLGHCMGGRTTYLGLVTNTAFKAGAAWYSGGVFASRGNEGASPFEKFANIGCPVIGFYGMQDKNPSPADVDKIEAELKRLGKSVEFHRYENTGHAFCNFAHPEKYREASAADSYRRAVAFLGKHLA
jgi:carboxymethylenebutenolidase